MILATPPPPSRPTDLQIKSDSITIGWNESVCDGGHQLDSFTIQYLDTDRPFFGFRGTVFIRNIDPKLRNYTITGLDPDTAYRIGIQAVSVERRGGAYSPFDIFTTLPPGIYIYVWYIKSFNSSATWHWQSPISILNAKKLRENKCRKLIL